MLDPLDWILRCVLQMLALSQLLLRGRLSCFHRLALETASLI